MQRKRWWIGCLAAVGVLAIVVTAAAQTPRPTTMSFRKGSTVNLFTGAAADTSRTGLIGGGAVGWELTPRFAVEGSGEWTEWGTGSRGFAAALTAMTGIAGSRTFMPFVTGGVGLYRASFGRLGADMPGFYVRRMTDMPPIARTAAFTDPSVVFGGGVNAFVNRHWAVRPDIREMLVFRDSRSRLVTTIAVHVAYHFEDHPITPRVR